MATPSLMHRSVAQLPGSMYPTATRKPGPENASTLRQNEAPAGTVMVRCTSGRLSAVRACAQPGSAGGGGGGGSGTTVMRAAGG